MSGMVFPDYYVGKLFPPRKSVLGSRKRQSALSGKRSTISYRAYPLYQWEVSFDSGNGGVLRDDIVRANYVAYSQAADQWTASNTGSGLLPKVFTNGIQAPDGTWTGDQVFLNKGTGSAGTDVSQLMAPSAAARAVGSMFTYSVWLRTLDGSTAVVALPKSAGGNFLCTVTPVWQRFSFSQAITAAIAGSAADFVGPALIGGAGTANYANLGVWGAQIEPGQFAGAYVRTFGAAVQHGDLKSLFGFYSAMVTAADTFLFMDPDFNSVQNHLFGLGTGGQTVYQLMATYNGGNQYPGPYGQTGVPELIQNLISSPPEIRVDRGYGALERLGAASYTNLCLQSQTLANAAWTKDATGTGSAPTVTATFAAGPDGTTTATRVQFNRGAGVTAGDASRIHQAVSVSAGIYTGSIWLKLNAGTSASLVLITGDGAGSVAPTSQTITVTNAWQRFQLTSQDASTTYVWVQLEGDVGAASTVDVLAWGGQIIAGVNAMKYLPTVGSTASATDYSISAVGLITFTSAPVLNLPLMWTGSFYYRCEFSDDQLDFAEFMNHLWDLKTLALEQIFL